MKRNVFNLSYSKLLTCDMGELVPIGLVEANPGDSIQLSSSMLLRCAPMLAPVMHPTRVRIHHWFVPTRLVWDSWQNFVTGGPDGLNASVVPTITMPGGGGAAVGSLADYLGVPTGVNSLVVSALPFRMYNLIFNEFYRDQDLVTPLVLVKTDGNDATTSTALQNVAWEKDYFTSARPWEQKGAAVSIPLTGSAPVKGLAGSTATTYTSTPTNYRETDGGGVTPPGTNWNVSGPPIGIRADNTTKIPQIYADMSAVSGITLNALRQASAVQRFLEARARYGSRYDEMLRQQYGVTPGDARLQRPEYLGGGVQTIQFSEVLATAETGATVDVGDMKGHGIAAMKSNRFRYFCQEHGYYITLMSVLPKTIYANGLFRHWSRSTKLDYFTPELAHIGQQAIKNKEVYAAHASPDATFGYQDRYDEYRRMESSIAGEFRTSVLDYWHMARIFGSSPALNSSFVQSVPPDRIFAAPANDVLYCQAYHNFRSRRCIPKVGTSFLF